MGNKNSDVIKRAISFIKRGINYTKDILGTAKITVNEGKSRHNSQEEQYIKLAKLEEKYGKLEPGVSVIIGTYKGEGKIDRCLDSLIHQSLDHSLFEVIFIINGERDHTDQKIHTTFSKVNTLNYCILYSDHASLPAARNIGIKAARKKYLCFLDDDDFLSHNYLKDMLADCGDFTMVFSQIVDVNDKGELNPNNTINKQLIQTREVEATMMHKLSTGNTMSGCKMLPTILVKDHPFIEELKSGEDVVFFTQLLTNWDFIFRVVPPGKNVIYYRLLSNNSMSRRSLSYEFNVTERLAVLAHLDQQLFKVEQPYRINMIKSKMTAQSGFIKRFLLENEHSREQVYHDIIKSHIVNFPFHIFNENKAKSLVVSYCFPPFVDTSGTVVAKRIRAEGELVDVIYNKMDTRRAINPYLSIIANEFIDQKYEIASPTSFSDWNAIKAFVDDGMIVIHKQVTKKGHYQNVYSRAMWPASHFLASAYKMQHAEVKWIAEFSDPLIFDIHGKEREAKITNSQYLKTILHELKQRNLPLTDSESLFFWCEYLTFVFADKIIFTNENQKNYMLNNFPIQEIIPAVLAKCTIKHQPTLPDMFYHVFKSDYYIDDSFVNLAYFGAFYNTRKLNELVEAVKDMSTSERKKLKIHIFTDQPEEFYHEIKGTSLSNVFYTSPYIDYFQFLNLTTRFDCVIVNDAVSKPDHDYNPYLPSKLSDYLGSGTDIWGLCEDGSVLSRSDIAYKSPIGDVEATKNMLEKIISETLSKKANQDGGESKQPDVWR